MKLAVCVDSIMRVPSVIPLPYKYCPIKMIPRVKEVTVRVVVETHDPMNSESDMVRFVPVISLLCPYISLLLRSATSRTGSLSTV